MPTILESVVDVAEEGRASSAQHRPQGTGRRGPKAIRDGISLNVVQERHEVGRAGGLRNSRDVRRGYGNFRGHAERFNRQNSSRTVSSTGQRLLTASIALPAALAVVFLAPGEVAFAVFLAIFLLIVVEFRAIARHTAPSAPLGSLLIWMPLAAVAGFLLVRNGPRDIPAWWLLTAASAIAAAAGITTLLARTDSRDDLAAMGILAFAIPFFAIPPVSLYWLQALDPWLLLALLAIVWIGDTAAWAIGKAIGRHKLAPSVSPKKTWEGAIAGFTAALLAMAMWSQLRLGELRLELLAVAAATAVAAQLGDLVESVIKRGAGVKDSSNLLPGHGGFFDRLDAMLLATPVYVVGLHALGVETLLPP